MDIATGAMNTILPKLGELVVGEYKLQKSVKGEIEELEKELTSMNAALRKVSKVQADQLDELTVIWVSDVKELSYDIEDAIDTFMLPGNRHQSHKPVNLKGLIDRTTDLFKRAKTNHKIHNLIKGIMDQVKKVSERRDRYKVDGVASQEITVSIDPRLEALYRKSTELVGVEGPKNELVKRLMEKDDSSRKQIKIISIVGFGGLGKTTVANALFQDLKTEFNHHVFVSVSLNPDISKILKNIFGQLGKDSNSYVNAAWDHMQLINKIREKLKNRRCFCVIDDVWNKSAWDTIKLALQDAGHGSIIVITTRNKAVAEHAGDVYELKPLLDDDSRKLFNKRVFDSEDDCPADLRKVYKNILKKCGGVPLAIITISSLLSSKPRTIQEWEEVNRSIGTGIGDSLDADKMRKILSLSYNDLPFHLKTCLLSVSKYPEDSEIKKDVLVWSWIAEGFITKDTQPVGTSLQEVGESYFRELINRSLIQPVDSRHLVDKDGELDACTVHDMVLELLIQLSSEEGFVTVLLSDGQQAGILTSSAAQNKKIRRISLHNSNKSYAHPDAREQLSKVRSLTVFGKVRAIPPLSSFHVLRVLQLDDCTGLDNNHFNDLTELRHLRFLQLRRYAATELPKNIGKLESLETLDIRGARERFMMLPMSFVKLRKLVSLFADTVELPDGLALGDMKSIQELGGICFTPEVAKEICNLKELRVLRIYIKEDILEQDYCKVAESILMFLKSCADLRELYIEAISRFNIPSGSLDFTKHVPSSLRRFICFNMAMTTFPMWINSSMLSRLTTLSIKLVEGFLPHHLEKLAELPSLRFLRLVENDCWWQKSRSSCLSIPSGSCAFRCLREFHFYAIVVFIEFQPGSMPVLQRIGLWFINQRIELSGLQDLGLENLLSLQHVIIKGKADDLGAEEEDDVRELLKDHPNHPSYELMLL